MDWSSSRRNWIHSPNKSVVKTIKDELIKRVVGLPFDAAKWFGPEIIQGL
jgi:hypothetical protein